MDKGEKVRYRKAAKLGIKPMMPSRSLLLAGPLLAFLASSCGSSPQELVLEVRKGETYSILELGRHLAGMEAEGLPFSEAEQGAVDLLREIAANDPGVADRMRAIATLASLQKIDNTSIFIQGLADKYWGVRWESAKALAARPDPKATGALVEILKKEKERIILLDAVEALSRIGDETALEALFFVLFDQTPRHIDNHMKAHAAICRLTGKNYGLDDVDKWAKYARERFLPAGEPPSGGKE